MCLTFKSLHFDFSQARRMVSVAEVELYIVLFPLLLILHSQFRLLALLRVIAQNILLHNLELSAREKCAALTCCLL